MISSLTLINFKYSIHQFPICVVSGMIYMLVLYFWMNNCHVKSQWAILLKKKDPTSTRSSETHSTTFEINRLPGTAACDTSGDAFPLELKSTVNHDNIANLLYASLIVFSQRLSPSMLPPVPVRTTRPMTICSERCVI